MTKRLYKMAINFRDNRPFYITATQRKIVNYIIENNLRSAGTKRIWIDFYHDKKAPSAINIKITKSDSDDYGRPITRRSTARLVVLCPNYNAIEQIAA